MNEKKNKAHKTGPNASQTYFYYYLDSQLAILNGQV